MTATYSSEAIQQALAALGDGPGRPVAWRAETGSTNDDARAALEDPARSPHGAVFLADTQTAGRGRSGRAWHSPPGCHIYVSMVLRPSVAALDARGGLGPAAVTLALGVAVANVADALLGTARARIKWPNDVWIDGKKVAGILVEGIARGDAPTVLIAGVGLNVGPGGLPPDVPATSLADEGATGLDRAQVAAQLVASLESAANDYFSDGLAPFIEALRSRDALRDRRLTIGGTQGVGAGVDDGGALLVRRDDGTTDRHVSGEVVLVSESTGG